MILAINTMHTVDVALVIMNAHIKDKRDTVLTLHFTMKVLSQL